MAAKKLNTTNNAGYPADRNPQDSAQSRTASPVPGDNAKPAAAAPEPSLAGSGYDRKWTKRDTVDSNTGSLSKWSGNGSW